MSYTPGGTNIDRELAKIALEFDAVLKRLAALESRPTTVAPLPAPAWWHDFTSIIPFAIHAKIPSRATLIRAFGRNAVRLLTMPGDTNVNGSGANERCDLRLGNDFSAAKEGREWWFAHAILFPDDYVEMPTGDAWQWGIPFNWHDDSDDGISQSPLQMTMMPRTAAAGRPTGLNFQVHGGTSGNKPLGEFPIGPIERNKWLDFVYHIRWTSGATGFCDGWLDGKKFMSHRGPTLHAGHGAYLKLSNYHMPLGRESAILHSGSVRGNEPASIKRGTTAASVTSAVLSA